MIQLIMIEAYCLILNTIDLSLFIVLKKREHRPKIELIPCVIPFMWNLKRNDTNELNLQNSKRLTDLVDEFMYARGKTRGRNS